MKIVNTQNRLKYFRKNHSKNENNSKNYAEILKIRSYLHAKNKIKNKK